VQGYLAALSASSYSYVSMLQHFGPLVNPGGAAISLTYIASERIIPGTPSCTFCQHPRSPFSRKRTICSHAGTCQTRAHFTEMFKMLFKCCAFLICKGTPFWQDRF